MFRSSWYVCLAVPLLFTSCSSSDADTADRFNEESLMYQIQERGVLRVAVPQDSPPWASGGGRPRGFLVDLGTFIAEDLEVDAEFVGADSNEMSRLVADESVDVAFPLRAVTFKALREETAEIGFAFASPFFVAHQRLLVANGSGIDQIADLDGGSACAVVDEATQVDISTLVDVDLVDAVSSTECLLAMKQDRIDAVTSVDALLASMQVELEASGSRSYEIVGDELNTEGYAAMTPPGSMAGYVIGELNDLEEDGRWLESYDEWLADYLGPLDAPPDLTLQDAASLYPPE
jgi:ABC-type amino acid transport substrate-binding protein